MEEDEVEGGDMKRIGREKGSLGETGVNTGGGKKREALKKQ